MRVGRAIEEMGFYWYEDPLADQDLYNYVKLKQKLDIPILATEYPIGGLDSYVPWILERATDFLRGDVAVKGGITTLIKTAHLAEAFRMNFETHHGGNSLNNVANLHVIMAIRNTEFFEVLLPDAMQKYGLAEDITVDRDGFVHAPTEPGLGAHIDFDLIERKKVGVLTLTARDCFAALAMTLFVIARSVATKRSGHELASLRFQPLDWPETEIAYSLDRHFCPPGLGHRSGDGAARLAFRALPVLSCCELHSARQSPIETRRGAALGGLRTPLRIARFQLRILGAPQSRAELLNRTLASAACRASGVWVSAYGEVFWRRFIRRSVWRDRMQKAKPAIKTEVIPYIFYRDVPAALEWLTRAFGFVEELRHATESGMHAQMTLDGQRIMMGQGSKDWRMQSPSENPDRDDRDFHLPGRCGFTLRTGAQGGRRDRSGAL